MTASSEHIYTDRHLVDRVLSGNEQAFGMIIRKTEGLVAQIVFKMVNDVQDRKDLAQDIYLKSFKNLSKFKFQSKLSTWIAQIAYNTCLNYLEKKKRTLRHNTYNEAIADNEFQTANSSRTGLTDNETETQIFQKQRTEILKAEMEKLPPIYKTLITLYHSEGLSYHEIMEITGLPDGTLKNYLFRARKILKDSILLKYKNEEL